MPRIHPSCPFGFSEYFSGVGEKQRGRDPTQHPAFFFFAKVYVLAERVSAAMVTRSPHDGLLAPRKTRYMFFGGVQAGLHRPERT